MFKNTALGPPVQARQMAPPTGQRAALLRASPPARLGTCPRRVPALFPPARQVLASRQAAGPEASLAAARPPQRKWPSGATDANRPPPLTVAPERGHSGLPQGAGLSRHCVAAQPGCEAQEVRARGAFAVGIAHQLLWRGSVRHADHYVSMLTPQR